jgi:hypothetical protein
LRDATLFVIASKGAVTEPRYFECLKASWHNSRVHIEILTRGDPTRSSPDQVLKSLDEFLMSINFAREISSGSFPIGTRRPGKLEQ